MARTRTRGRSRPKAADDIAQISAAQQPPQEPAVVGTCACGAEGVCVLAPEYAEAEGKCHVDLPALPEPAEDPAEQPADEQPQAADAAPACPHDKPVGECPVCAYDAPQPADPPADPEPASDESIDTFLDALLTGPRPVTDEEWDAFVADAPDETDLLLDEDENVLAQRTDDDGDTWVVTSAGRKIGISPDGWIAVVTGPDLTQTPAHQPERRPWKERLIRRS